ncbi:MAG: hypothetical protein KA998_03445 [Rickettsiaceae bacterium]|nr:hypothetical protein [Rickettsiaceae bacterium]
MAIDEKFWLAVSFVVFILLVYKPAKAALIKYLDSEIAKIKKDIKEAADLKTESIEMVKHFSKLLEETNINRKNVIAQARYLNQKSLEESRIELEMMIDVKNKDIEQRINNLKQEASSEIAKMLTTRSGKLVEEYISREQKSLPTDIEIVKHLMKE